MPGWCRGGAISSNFADGPGSELADSRQPARPWVGPLRAGHKEPVHVSHAPCRIRGAPDRRAVLEEALACPRIAIEAVEPVVDGGRFAAKAIAGEPRTVSAVIFADGHDKLAAHLLWRESREAQWQREPMQPLGNDHWQARFVPPGVGRVVFAVEAWWDLYASYCDELAKKHAAGVSIALELREGVAAWSGSRPRLRRSRWKRCAR